MISSASKTALTFTSPAGMGKVVVLFVALAKVTASLPDSTSQRAKCMLAAGVSAVSVTTLPSAALARLAIPPVTEMAYFATGVVPPFTFSLHDMRYFAAVFPDLV